MQTLIKMTVRFEDPEEDQSWSFEGDVPFLPGAGSEVIVDVGRAVRVRVDRVDYHQRPEGNEVLLADVDADESGVSAQQVYEHLSSIRWQTTTAPPSATVRRPLRVAATPSPGGYMSAQQAAAELGLTDRRIAQLCASGTLKAYKNEHDQWCISRRGLTAYERELSGMPQDSRRRHRALATAEAGAQQGSPILTHAATRGPGASVTPRSAPRRPEQSLNELLTVAQVCERLSVKPSWVYAQIAIDRLPVVRVGRMVRFRRSVIDDIVEHGYRG